MDFTVRRIAADCPFFSESGPPITNRLILKENREISHLKPSSMIQNRLLLLIQRIFQAVLNWLYPFAKTNYVGIVAALDKNSEKAFEALSFPEILDYFQRFFKSDRASSPRVSAAISHLQTQYQAIEALKQGKEEKFRAPLQDWKREIEKLKDGEQRFIVANTTPGNELFYLFSKKEGQTSLKLIGRGATMTRLSGVQEISIAGEAKVVSSLNLGSSLKASELLDFSPLGTMETTFKAFEELVKKHLVKEEDLSNHLATKTKNLCNNVLWNALEQMEKSEGRTASDWQRTQLRLEIFTLFSVLKEYRFSLKANFMDVQTLERMLRICSQSLAKAYEAKVISDAEVKDLVQELECIQTALKQVAKSSQKPLNGLRMPSMETYSFKNFTVNSPADIAPPKVKAIDSPRPPHLAPPSSPGAPLVRNEERREASLPLREQLERLVSNSTPQQIVKAIYAIDFSPYPSAHLPINPESVWLKFSPEEAKALMKQFNTLSRRLVDFSTKEKELPIDMYEALIKMSYMVLFLTHFNVNKGVWTPESTALKKKVFDFGAKLSARCSIEENRYGHCIHRMNVHTNKQLYDFYWNLLTAGKKAFSSFKLNLSHPVEELSCLQEQVDLLTYLTPLHPSHMAERGSLSAAIHGWIAPLPFPLLAAFHLMGIQISSENKDSLVGNRDTPEAIQHDPESTLHAYEQLLVNEEIAKWRKDIEDELKLGQQEISWSGVQEIQLQDSPFGGEIRKQRLQAVLKKQEEYLLRASQLGISFSKEELTALLSLLRTVDPQREVIAFIKAHEALLANPAVRSYIQLIFFGPFLLGTLKAEHGSLADTFCTLMPRFFAEKIAECKQKAEVKPSEMATLLFLMQMSERLKEIYEELKATANPAAAIKFDTSAFYPVGNAENQDFIQNQRKRDPASPASIEMISMQLKVLLAKPKLSQQELCQIILDMELLSTKAQQVSSFDYRELFWIKGSYQELMQEAQLDEEHLTYVLDTLCHRKGLLLDASPWKRTFPTFSNNQYSIDLATGTIRDLASEAMTATLPSSVITQPLFEKTFPDLLKQEIRAMKSQKDGTTVYFFEDLKKNPCRIEEKNGVYAFYRSFPKAGHPEFLQAAATDAATHSLADVTPSLSNILKQLQAEKNGVLEPPAILKQRLFIDPKVPTKGYIVSSSGEMELEVHLKREKSGVKIEHVIDLRGNAPSEPLQLVGLSEMNHPALKRLEQIEDPAHILIFGKKGGLFKSSSIEKIELPRYGLAFALKKGSLVCLDPQLAGYRVRLSATLEERKGYAFSLLLEHPDRTKPAKLLIAPAEAIHQGVAPMPSYFGLAYLIWLVKTLLSAVLAGALPAKSGCPFLHIQSPRESLPRIVVDINPHTKEILYTPVKQREQAQELILQAVKVGNPEGALDALHAVQIETEEREIAKWIGYLGDFEEEHPAIGLKIAEKLFDKIRGHKKFEELVKRLQSKEADLFRGYLKTVRSLNAPLRIRRETFDRIADYMQLIDPSYYGHHVAPFFLKVGETFALPISRTLHPKPEKESSSVKKLEEKVHPENPIDRGSLAQHLELIPQPAPLLFDKKDLEDGKRFLKKILIPKRKEMANAKARARGEIEALLSSSSDPHDQLLIFAKERKIASFSDVALALLQDDFESLSLPVGIDRQRLKAAAISFFDCEVKLNLIVQCEKEARSLLDQKKKLTSSTHLLGLVSYGRQYSIEKNPELLIFEAFHFVTFRNGIHPTQLELLQSLLKEPASIVQAGTGSGKSSVLGALRGLMRANGKNLVTQKVLPHLLQETVSILQERFGRTFKRKVYPFLFSQSMPLFDREGNSLFEKIYHNLLETTQNKGIVLTDYKSFVLLEQKFWALSKQIQMDPNCPLITYTHWLYLNKILLLLKNREDQLMDEFDQPLSAVQRIQTQLREGSLFERWMIKESVGLYAILKGDPELKLQENLQADIPKEVRLQSIQRAARKLAQTRWPDKADQIYSYLIGESEAVLDHIQDLTPADKDALAFLKEQCTIYLPLTLDRASLSNYSRSKDGKKVLTRCKGEKRDAKFGNPIEEINYTIQDYLQNRVALSTLREWTLEAKKDWAVHPEEAERRFRAILPDISLSYLVHLTPDDFEDELKKMLPYANQQATPYFLRRHLEALRCSGIVISMNPQDSVAMSLAVSGMSATVGSLGSLHDQFKKNTEIAEKTRQESIERIKSRSYGNPIRYNPSQPLDILNTFKNDTLCSIIDGAGAFRNVQPKCVAEALLKANPRLKSVGFYDEEGRQDFIGDPRAAQEEKGFYFPQGQTRGSDQVLRPDAVALLMTNEKGDIEEFIQEEGRMRLPQQKVQIAVSDFASPSLNTLDAIIEKKKQNEREKNQEDRYMAEPQRLRNGCRSNARQELLKTTDLNRLQTVIESTNSPPSHCAPLRVREELAPFTTRFQTLEPLFIQPLGNDELKPGEYFQKHRAIVKRNADPVQELKNYKERLLNDCRRLGLTTAELNNYDPHALRPDLPAEVMPLAFAESQQQEVQEELELNNELHLEQEEEQELQREHQVSESKVDSYLPRYYSMGMKNYSVQQFHPAFSDKILVTNSYLPLERQAFKREKGFDMVPAPVPAIHKRRPFDERTPRIGVVRLVGGNIIIGDLLDEIDMFQRNQHGSTYDIRTGLVTDLEGGTNSAFTNTKEFRMLIAQVKFLDGMTDGYTKDEMLCLSEWLQKNNPKELYLFFQNTILKHRPESKFPHSQLWNLFQALATKV